MHSRHGDNSLLKMYSIVQTMLKYLTCANCKHTFCFRGTHQFRGKIPLLLECGHAVCEICAKTCPTKACGTCGIAHQQNFNDQPIFSVNLYLLGLINSNKSARVNCIEPKVEFQQPTAARFRKSITEDIEYCSECGVKAEYRCRQCEVFFCSSCYTKIHGRALQNHQKIPMAENENDISNFLSSKCELHPAEIIQFSCIQCDVPACTNCLLLSHQGHSIISQSQKFNESKAQIEDMLSKLAETLQRVKQTEKKLGKHLIFMDTSQDSDSDREKIESKLTQHFVYLHGVLQNIENNFINQLRERQHHIGNNINTVKEQLKEQREELKNAIVLATSAIKTDSAVNVTAIIDKLEKTLNMPCHLVYNSFSDDKIELHIDESIVNSIKEHCTLEFPPISAYSLARTEDLPEDYEIEPIVREEFARPFIPTAKQTQLSLSKNSLSASTLSLRGSDEKQNGGLVAGSSEVVKITHIKDPGCFYTQLVCHTDTLTQLHKSLTRQATISAMPSELELNKMYLVQYGSDMQWYRGRVKTIYKDEKDCQVCDIFYVDYGNTECSVPLKRMRNMSLQSSLVPIMARQCTLHDIVPKNDVWEVDANKAMYEMIDGISHTIMHVFEVCNDVYHVDIMKNSLGDGDNTLSIRDALIFLEYGSFITNERLRKTSSQSIRKFFEEDIAIENSYDVRVTHLESPDCIHVQKIGDSMTHLMKLTSNMMAEYGKIASNKGIIYTPEIGMPCAALYTDGTWYRGRISNLLGNQKVEVFFVDFGDTREYKYNEIRRLHYKFMTVTALAFKVALKDVAPVQNNEWSLDIKDFMTENLMARFLRIFVFSKESDSFKVILYIPSDNKDINFNALLAKSNFALSTGSSSQFIDFPKAATKKRRKKLFKAKKLAKHVHDIEDEDAANESDESDPFRLQVHLLQAVSPACIYVSDIESLQVVKNMIEDIQNFYNKYKSAESENWEKDDVCIAYSPKDKSYYRSKIVEIIPPEAVIVFLYDVGITETVTIQDLQSLHPKFSTIPPRAFKIKLAGILPCGGSATWLSSSCEVLTDLINENQDSRFYISKVAGIEDDAISVELWVRETRTTEALAPTIVEINSINRKLVKKGVALPIRGYKHEQSKVLGIELRQQLLQNQEENKSSKVEWVVKNQVSSCPSNATSDTSVLALSIEMSQSDIASENDDDNSSVYSNPEAEDESDEKYSLPPRLSAWIPPAPITDDRFCAISTNVDQNCIIYLHSVKQNSETLADIDAALQTHFNGSKPKACDMVWARNDMCIAQYHADKKWYRAQVLEVLDNDEIKVIFVDYGNVDECKLGTLRKRVIMGHIPIQTTKCVVHGLVPDTPNGEWTTPDLDVIHALVVDKKSDVKVLQKKPEHLVISMALKSFEDVDLVMYLKHTLNFKISDFGGDEKSQDKSRDADSELDSTDNADVIIEEYVEDYMPKTIAEPTFLSLCSNSESTCQERSKDENCKDIITGPMNASDNEVLVDLDPSTQIFQNSDLIIVSDDADNISSCGMGSFEKSINVSSTPQNEENDDYLPVYTYIEIPDHVQIINLIPQYVEDPTVFYGHLDESSEVEFLDLYLEQFTSLTTQMQEKAPHQPKLKDISLDAPCCAKYTSDDQWYRAKIIKIEPDSDQVAVQYVDYGNREYQPIDQIHSLAKEWLAVPIMGLKCRLSGIRVNPAKPSWKTQTAKFGKIFYQGAIKSKIKNRSIDTLDVELYSDESCTKLLYEFLLEDGLFQIAEQ